MNFKSSDKRMYGTLVNSLKNKKAANRIINMLVLVNSFIFTLPLSLPAPFASMDGVL